MGKRILSLILALTVILSAFCFTASAAETVDEKTAVLQSLGIIDESFSGRIYHDIYIKAVMNLVFTGEAITTENFARNIGFVEAGESYKGTNVTTIGEAVKFAVIAAGYKAATDGTEQSYASVGNRIGLYKGVKGGATEALSYENAICILYNLLEVNPLIWSYPNDYKVQDKEDMLGMYKAIYLHKGIVTANEYTAINGAKGVREDEIAINGQVFETAVEYDPEILGKPVEVYIQERKGEDPVILYVGVIEGKYESLTIAADDIENVAADFSSVEYLEEGGEKVRKAEFESQLRVIYNGKFYGNYQVADLMPELGEITLIDSNGVSGYELVKVASYQTMIVESINVTKKIITNKYDFAGCLDYVSLDGHDVVYNVYKNDKKVALGAIKTGNVLSVAASKNADEMLYNIYVSDVDEKSAVVSLIPEEKEIETEDDIYTYSSDFEKHLADKGQTVQLGREYTFCLDAFGNIAYVIRTMNDDYVLLFKIGQKGGMDDEVEVKYLTVDGDWKISKLADKVKYGIGNEKNSVTPAKVFSYLRKRDPQVVKIKENVNGEISSIVTARQTSAYEDGTFRKTMSTEYIYRGSMRTFDSQLYVNTATRMFVLPEIATGDEDDYYVTNALDVLLSDRGYPVSAYDADNFGHTNLISIIENDSVQKSRISRSLFIVTGISQAISDDGDICRMLTGTVDGLRNISFLVDPTETTPVSIGDIINVRMSKDGIIDMILVRVQASDPFTKKALSDYHHVGNVENGTDVCSGVVIDIDAAGGKIKLDCGTSVSFVISSLTTCVVYDETKEKCELSTIYGLMKGDKLHVRLNQSRVNEIIKVVE